MNFPHSSHSGPEDNLIFTNIRQGKPGCKIFSTPTHSGSLLPSPQRYKLPSKFRIVWNYSSSQAMRRCWGRCVCDTERSCCTQTAEAGLLCMRQQSRWTRTFCSWSSQVGGGGGTHKRVGLLVKRWKEEWRTLVSSFRPWVRATAHPSGPDASLPGSRARSAGEHRLPAPTRSRSRQPGPGPGLAPGCGYADQHLAASVSWNLVLRYWFWAGSEMSVCFAAVRSDCRDLVELLLLGGAEVNRDVCHGRKALHEASRLGRVAMVTLLLKAGAHPDPRSHYGLTPLALAAQEGHQQVVEALLKKGWASAPFSSKIHSRKET